MVVRIEKFKIMTKNYKIENIEDTKKFSNNLCKTLKNGDIICLIGDLGVGKTFISKQICDFFGVDNFVISPTFNILKSYITNDKKIKTINHFDLYRIKNEDELYNIGFEDVIYDKNAIAIIEWPEIAYNIIPKKHINIIIKYDNDNENGRLITYEKIQQK